MIKASPNTTNYQPQPHDHTSCKQDYAYSYENLNFNNHEIRILVLKLEDKKHRWSCSLEHVSLNEPGPYMALSYHWGDPSKLRRIRIGSSTVFVTANLKDALRAILKARHKLCRDPSKPIRLWVDAVCINQEDDQERSQQVQRLSQIYSRAEQVVAWVGPTKGNGRKLSSNDIESLKDLRTLGPERFVFQLTAKQHEAADLLFSERYWRRVWIIQEITVASKVTILYGGCDFQWDDVVAIISLLKEMKGSSENANYNKFLKATHLLEFRDEYAGPTGISLLEAMIWSRLALATELRDKIFALLGLCVEPFRV